MMDTGSEISVFMIRLGIFLAGVVAGIAAVKGGLF